MASQSDFSAPAHADLCAMAVKWLQRPHSGGGPGCLVAVSEVAGGWTGEIPDAIGFSLSHGEQGSTVIEVKVSRSDFLADRKKPQWLLVKLLARLGDTEKLNQQRREDFRERQRLANRVNELNRELAELRRDIRWQTRQDRLASQAAVAPAISA